MISQTFLISLISLFSLATRKPAMQIALDRLKENFGPAILETHSQHGNETAVVEKDKIVEIIRFLKDAAGLEFNFMMDLAGVDYPERRERFEVVYHLYSLKTKKRRSEEHTSELQSQFH